MIRRPLHLLKDNWLSDITHVEHNVLDYVSAFCKRLHRACETAQETAGSSKLNTLSLTVQLCQAR